MNANATFGLILAGLATLNPPAAERKSAPQPFQPTWGSLRQYRCPEWFRDAAYTALYGPAVPATAWGPSKSTDGST
jgi:hypothetical protein